jgi:hypothetical protein
MTEELLNKQWKRDGFIHFQHAQTGMFGATAQRLKPRATTCEVGLRRLQST